MGIIKDLLVALDDEKILEEVKKQLDSGTKPEDIINECQAGMVAIGEEFAAHKMFVSDLMMSGSIFESISELVMPLLKSASAGKNLGKVVLGTVKDDIHNIGKDIVGNMLLASGFDVIDVGVDVAPEVFVKALKENDVKVLALSCLLVSCYDSIKATVTALEEAGLRDSVKVIIGGGPIDGHVVAYTGADTFGADAQAAVVYCREVLA